MRNDLQSIFKQSVRKIVIPITFIVIITFPLSVLDLFFKLQLGVSISWLRIISVTMVWFQNKCYLPKPLSLLISLSHDGLVCLLTDTLKIAL